MQKYQTRISKCHTWNMQFRELKSSLFWKEKTMKIRAEPEGSYFYTKLRRRNTGESVNNWKKYSHKHILSHCRSCLATLSGFWKIRKRTGTQIAKALCSCSASRWSNIIRSIQKQVIFHRTLIRTFVRCTKPTTGLEEMAWWRKWSRKLKNWILREKENEHV